MPDSTQQSLRFPPVNGLSIRANFDGGALSSDFGPILLRGVDRKPLDEDNDLASAPTFSRLENAASTKDIYRLAQALVDQFIDRYDKPPKVIVLDMDHSEDAAYGQQEHLFYNHHYRSYCYLPLFLFEGLSGQLITAALRPGKRPTGAENAMIIKRVLKHLRVAWPNTHIGTVAKRSYLRPRACRNSKSIIHQ